MATSAIITQGLRRSLSHILAQPCPTYRTRSLYPSRYANNIEVVNKDFELLTQIAHLAIGFPSATSSAIPKLCCTQLVLLQYRKAYRWLRIFTKSLVLFLHAADDDLPLNLGRDCFEESLDAKELSEEPVTHVRTP